MSQAFFFFNDTATTEIYTLSLHDALPILAASEPDETSADVQGSGSVSERGQQMVGYLYESTLSSWLLVLGLGLSALDRKSTRLNSSHANISYAVFCLKKKIIERGGPTSLA